MKFAKISQSWRRPLLGPSPGWKCLIIDSWLKISVVIVKCSQRFVMTSTTFPSSASTDLLPRTCPASPTKCLVLCIIVSYTFLAQIRGKQKRRNGIRYILLTETHSRFTMSLSDPATSLSATQSLETIIYSGEHLQLVQRRKGILFMVSFWRLRTVNC